MKPQNTPMSRFRLTLLLLMMSSVIPMSAMAQQLRNTGATTAMPEPESKHISSIRSQSTPNGSRVILTFTEALTDYGAYRNGDKFTVMLPQTALALTEINVKGAGFTNSKVESRGANLAVSFQLEANVESGLRGWMQRRELGRPERWRRRWSSDGPVWASSSPSSRAGPWGPRGPRSCWRRSTASGRASRAGRPPCWT